MSCPTVVTGIAVTFFTSTALTALGYVLIGSLLPGYTTLTGLLPTYISLYVGLISVTGICCLSQSFIPIGDVMCGYIGVGFGGIIVGGIGIGSNVSGVITGGGITTGGAGGGGMGYVLDPESKQHNNPNNPNNPNSPGHHFQQSLDSLYL